MKKQGFPWGLYYDQMPNHTPKIVLFGGKRACVQRKDGQVLS